MSLALHGHHVLLIATLAFFAAVLTPNWYTNTTNNSNKGIYINVFQICANSTSPPYCSWVLPLGSNNLFSGEIKSVYPILTASFAIACAGLSFLGLLLGSWYIQQHASDNASRGLLISIIFITLFSFLLSCGVWIVMLTTNMHQSFGTTEIMLKQLGFSFWINIGSSGGYLVALLLYLFAIRKD